MLHNFSDYEQDVDAIQKIFAEMKAQNLYKYSAISAYSYNDYNMIAESGFDATQIPLNVFDWSKIEDGGIEKLEKAGMMVFARSVFLQGLVFRTPEMLDPRMDFCVPYVAAYRKLCEEFELNPGVLALSFALSVPGISTAVLGCRNIKQVINNCELFDQTVELTKEQMEKLHNAFHNTDPRVINPGVWFNHT